MSAGLFALGCKMWDCSIASFGIGLGAMVIALLFPPFPRSARCRSWPKPFPKSSSWPPAREIAEVMHRQACYQLRRYEIWNIDRKPTRLS